MKLNEKQICEHLHSISDVLAECGIQAARQSIQDLVRRIAGGVEPSLDAKERLELLAGRELIASLSGQLQESRWAVDRLSSHGCEILERLIAAGAKIEIHDPRA